MTPASASHARPAGSGRPLLELDPELGQLLTDDRRRAADRELRVRVTGFPIGEWDGGRLADADPAHIGLLLIDGVLAREVVLWDTVSTELLGPGDVVRPWRIEGMPQLLPVTVRWNALASVRLALIDRRTAGVLRALSRDRRRDRGPPVGARRAPGHHPGDLAAQPRRPSPARALLAPGRALGRVARDGIAVPLVLSHRLIGELVGARRPTVSTALAELARARQLVRREDGTWLLTGEPIAVAAETAAELVRQRRRLPPTEPVSAPRVPVHVPNDRLLTLRASLEAARAAAQRHKRDLDFLQAETAELRDRTVELRITRQLHLDALRAAAARRNALSAQLSRSACARSCSTCSCVQRDRP